MLRHGITLLVAVMAMGCGGLDITPQPPIVTDQNKCESACVRLQQLGCEEGSPIDMHQPCAGRSECVPGQECTAGACTVTCTQFCISTENAGVWLDPGCVARITSCGQIDSCPIH